MARIGRARQEDVYYNGAYTVVRKAWLREALKKADSEVRGAAEEAMAFAGGKGDTVALDRW